MRALTAAAPGATARPHLLAALLLASIIAALAATPLAASEEAPAEAEAPAADTDPDATAEAPADTLVERVEVTVTRAGEDAPAAFTNMSHETIEKEYWTQEVPSLLAATPAVHYHSDAGNDIGYAYLYIRGFQQRRIAVTINGTPLNTAETHEVFWVDLPNLVDSTLDIQVQRGVGTTLYGANPIGGTVNLETARSSEGPGWTAEGGYGSYGTSKITASYSSPALGKGWTVSARASRIDSDGYRDQSWTKMGMGFLSAERQGARSRLRLNLYGGVEELHLAYIGLSREELAVDRRANPLTWDGAIDHFTQPHLEMIHEYDISESLELGNTVYGFYGRGYWDQRTYWFDELFLPREFFQRANVEEWDAGWIPRVSWDHGGGTLTAGAEVRIHRGHQWSEVLGGETPPVEVMWDYRIPKDFYNLFVEEEWRPLPGLTVLAGLKGASTSWQLEDDSIRNYSYDVSYSWLAPRLGVSYRLSPSWLAFGSISESRREPRVIDLYDPTWGSVPSFGDADPTPGSTWSDPLIDEEKVVDYELGGSYSSSGLFLRATLYHMDFRDEIVDSGALDNFGRPITSSAARSTHRGIEIEGTGRLGRGFELGGYLTLTDDTFDEHTEYVYDWDTDITTPVDVSGNRIANAPDRTARLALSWSPRWGRLELGGRHVGRVFFTNFEDREFSLDPYTVLHLDARWDLPFLEGQDLALRLRVNNLLDELYEPGGHVDWVTGEARFIPAAERNVFLMLTYRSKAR
jgi:iron complex outermembrane receptor protein